MVDVDVVQRAGFLGDRRRLGVGLSVGELTVRRGRSPADDGIVGCYHDGVIAGRVGEGLHNGYFILKHMHTNLARRE